MGLTTLSGIEGTEGDATLSTFHPHVRCPPQTPGGATIGFCGGRAAAPDFVSDGLQAKELAIKVLSKTGGLQKWSPLLTQSIFHSAGLSAYECLALGPVVLFASSFPPVFLTWLPCIELYLVTWYKHE